MGRYKREVENALIRILYNSQEESYHPIIYLEQQIEDGKRCNGMVRFLPVKYREEGFYVRGNAVKSVYDDTLITQLQAQGYKYVHRQLGEAFEILWPGKQEFVPAVVRIPILEIAVLKEALDEMKANQEAQHQHAKA